MSAEAALSKVPLSQSPSPPTLSGIKEAGAPRGWFGAKKHGSESDRPELEASWPLPWMNGCGREPNTYKFLTALDLPAGHPLCIPVTLGLEMDIPADLETYPFFFE